MENEALVMAFRHSARKLAFDFCATSAAHFEFNDALGVAQLALVDCASRFEKPASGDDRAVFWALARRRISGSLIDMARTGGTKVNLRKSGGAVTFVQLETADTVATTQPGLADPKLARAVDELPERWRMILGLFYVEGMTAREVTERLGFAKYGCRVHQIRRQALGRLRSYLEAGGVRKVSDML